LKPCLASPQNSHLALIHFVADYQIFSNCYLFPV
jgi:hypothetical protein